nr:hypothetical protein Iba_chr09aCG11530 [Ipomoea batatas]
MLDFGSLRLSCKVGRILGHGLSSIFQIWGCLTKIKNRVRVQEIYSIDCGFMTEAIIRTMRTLCRRGLDSLSRIQQRRSWAKIWNANSDSSFSTTVNPADAAFRQKLIKGKSQHHMDRYDFGLVSPAMLGTVRRKGWYSIGRYVWDHRLQRRILVSNSSFHEFESGTRECCTTTEVVWLVEESYGPPLLADRMLLVTWIHCPVAGQLQSLPWCIEERSGPDAEHLPFLLNDQHEFSDGGPRQTDPRSSLSNNSAGSPYEDCTKSMSIFTADSDGKQNKRRFSQNFIHF